MFNFVILLYLISVIIRINSDECQFLTMCKCTNFPLFTLYDSSYLSKPRSTLNQDLFCTYLNNSDATNVLSPLQTFEQLKYFYYRFRTLTFANYPSIPSRAFRSIHFESESVKQTPKINNRNVIALINVEQTNPCKTFLSLIGENSFESFSSSSSSYSDLFAEMNLVNSENQLIVSFLHCPRLIYANAGLAQLKCVELKLQNTPSGIPIDFFRDAISIGHLIIHNPSFVGFLPSSSRSTSVHFELHQLSIRDISVRHLKGKHFPIVFSSLKILTLENFLHSNGFRSWNSRDLAERFPHLTTLKIFSCSIQRLLSRAFEYFDQLEYLTLDGITTIENDAFFNLYHLKQLDLGKDIRRLDSYAFLHMNSDVLLLLNRSLQYRLDDEKDFCTFAQFSSTKQSKSFVRFPLFFNNFCSCTIRYIYRHIDKSLVSLTPSCYANASVYILTQEERICYFEQRLLQCDILPNGGITIYGQHYNVSYFYAKQLSKGHKRFAIFFQYRIYYLFASGIFFIVLLILFYLQRQRQKRTCRHLNRLLKRANLSRENTRNLDIIYQSADEQIDLNNTSRSDRSTKV